MFDENGVDIELAPITILTGKNSAGKSSIVKAIAVLNHFLAQIKRDKENDRAIKLNNYKIQFNELFEGTLGNFESVLHHETKECRITFEYVIHSTMLFEDVKVSISFKDADEDKDDKHLHYGIVCKFCVKSLQDDNIYFSDEDGFFCYNLNYVKEKFFDFAIGESLSHIYLGVSSDEEMSREERRKKANLAKDELVKLDEKKLKNIYRYLRDPFSSKKPIIHDINTLEEFMSFLNEGKQIFYIPVINECLKGLVKEEISAKVEDILNYNKTLDDAEKYVIRRFISDIVAKDKDIDEFWIEQENKYLESVGKANNQTEEQNFICKFLQFAQKGVRLPNTVSLEVGDSLWGNYPGLWITKNDDKEKKAKEIEKWKNVPLDTFPKMYEVLMRLNAAYENWMMNTHINYSPRVIYSYEDGIEHPAGRYRHYVYQLLCEYASRVIESVLFPIWTESFIYIPSSRALPKRLYTSDTGKDFYSTLNSYLIAKTEYDNYLTSFRGSNKKEYITDSFLNKWIGKEGFDICKSISVESVMGSAIIVKLIKDDGTEVFLTDEGYGLTQLVSMLISIETAILKAKGVKYNNYYHLADLDGLNTSKFYFEQQTIAVEEPEIHLHPAFQSKLTDMFVAASEYNIHFIVETHSEYLVRKIQKLVAIKTLEDKEILSSSEGIDSNNVSIYYLYDADITKRPNTSTPQILKIELDKNGYPQEPFGAGFFDVADDLSMDLLTLQIKNK